MVMSKYLIENTTMENIVSSIRELTGETGPISGNNLENLLATAATTKIDPPTGTLTITSNNIYNVRDYENVLVNISQSGIVFENYTAEGYPTLLRLTGMTTVPNHYFRSCNQTNYFYKAITKILIEEPASYVGECSFDSFKSATEIIVAQTVTSYGSYWCRNCANLTRIEFFGNVSPNYSWFTGSSLKQFICHGQVDTIRTVANFPSTMELYDLSGCTEIPILENVAALNHTDGCIIRVPNNLLNNWKAATNWCDLPTNSEVSGYVIWEGV